MVKPLKRSVDKVDTPQLTFCRLEKSIALGRAALFVVDRTEKYPNGSLRAFLGSVFAAATTALRALHNSPAASDCPCSHRSQCDRGIYAGCQRRVNPQAEGGW